jgi:hypothetical protein
VYEASVRRPLQVPTNEAALKKAVANQPVAVAICASSVGGRLLLRRALVGWASPAA